MISDMVEYPSLRVLIGFLLTPILAGILLFLCWYSYLYVDGFISWKKGEDSLKNSLGLFFIFVIGGLFFYITPSFLTSLLYVKLRFYKNKKSYILVFMVGGGGAFLWLPILFFIMSGKFSLSSSNLLEGVSDIYYHFSIFILGGLSSFIMGVLVLPKETPNKLNQRLNR